MSRAIGWLRGVLVVAQQAVVSLRYNWGIGVLSLVLALSLWVYVTDQENPEVTGRVAGTVTIEAVNVPPDQAVVSLSQDSVTVRARASESVFERLTVDDFRATIDLADVSSQEAEVVVRVESEEPRAEVVEAQPARVTVRLDTITSRAVPVQPRQNGTLPRGFEAIEISVDIDQATVTGPRSLVELVEAVEADVNLTGVQTSFEETVLLQARGAGGNSIEGVEIEPESATVTVEVEQNVFTKTFVVSPDVTGVPAVGYAVTAIEVNPTLVELSATLDALQSIDAVAGIPTEEVSIEGAGADVVRTVALRLPEGVTAVRTDVTVRVAIAPAQGQTSIAVAPRPSNLGAGLTATFTPATVQVVLAGATSDLQALEASQVIATVDLNGLAAGEHVAPVSVQAPAGAQVVSVSPPQVGVTLQ
ncbi:MAG: CdaR family protein [Dehalococcoidia bacterium]